MTARTRENEAARGETWRALVRASAWLKRASPVIAVIALGALVLVLHARRYMPFFADDSYISMRYAERFLEGKGLTWNDGERVEGYSNLLWVLALALVSAPGFDMLAAARVLGSLCFVGCMAAVAYNARPRVFRDRALFIASVGVVAMAFTGTVAVWAIAGLEHPLLAVLLTSSITLILHNLREPRLSDETRGLGPWLAPALLLGFATWTRPDAPLFPAVIAGTLLLVPSRLPRRYRPALLIVGVTALFVLAQLCFRVLYYGDWVPNTAHAKLAWTWLRVRQGFDHLGRGYSGLWPLVLMALCGVPALFSDSGARLRVLVPWLPALCWSLYLGAIGGDFFAAWRHFVPPVVLLSLALTEGLGWWAARSARVWWSACAACTLLLALLLHAQLKDEGVKNAIHERWEWGAPPIGALLRKHFGEKAPLFAVDSAGCLPYYSKLPSLDMLGLNDRYLALHPPADMGSHDLGHELGNGYYVLSRRPDLVLFGVPSDHGRPKFRGGREMFDTAEFQESYDHVVFVTGRPATFYRTWVYRDSEKIGMLRAPNRITIPGYLFAASDDTPAVEDSEGRLAVRVSRGKTLEQSLMLDAGVWRVHLDQSARGRKGASGPKRSDVRVRLSGEGVSRDASTWRVKHATRVKLKLSTPRREPGFVRRVELERSPLAGTAFE